MAGRRKEGSAEISENCPRKAATDRGHEWNNVGFRLESVLQLVLYQKMRCGTTDYE